MSTVATPPLIAGERLDRATFHERYEAMPPRTRAELIGGVVHMPSPMFYDHGFESRSVVIWLGHYQRQTPGVVGVDGVTTILDDEAEPQPDHNLLILPECGGQTRVEGGYLAGAPELIVEVSKSSRRVDLGAKKADYERTGVGEYIVVALDPDEVFWFALVDGRFERLAPGEDGLLRSPGLPGLWLDPSALFAGDLNRLVAAVDLGVATPEHAAFVARLGRA